MRHPTQCTHAGSPTGYPPPPVALFLSKQEKFASEIIPQYFDHNKFSSFARQLNFYGFRKIQTKPIRNEDFDKSTAKHVTFFNEVNGLLNSLFHRNTH